MKVKPTLLLDYKRVLDPNVFELMAFLGPLRVLRSGWVSCWMMALFKLEI
jgi:hypothetical protein